MNGKIAIRTRVLLALGTALMMLATLVPAGVSWAEDADFASATDNMPSSFQITMDGDQATLSWAAPINQNLVGYEYFAFQRARDGFYDPTIDSPLPQGTREYFLGDNAFHALAKTIRQITIPHLYPGDWEFAVRAVYAPDLHSGWVEPVGHDVQSGDPQVSVQSPVAIFHANPARIYSTDRTLFEPGITGLPASYSLIYHVGSQIIKAVSADVSSDSTVDWSTVSGCSISADTTILADPIYLTPSELSAIAGTCPTVPTSGIAHFDDRKLPGTSFDFKATPIPTQSATFIESTGAHPHTETLTWFDGDTPNWPNVPARNPKTGETFSGLWTDSSGQTVDSRSSLPADGETYTAQLSAYESPLVPRHVSVAGNNFSGPDQPGPIGWNGPSNVERLVWTGNEDGESLQLPFSVDTIQGITWTATLDALDSLGKPLGATAQLTGMPSYFDLHTLLNSEGSPMCDQGLIEPGCPHTYRIKLETRNASGDTNDFQFDVIWALPDQTFDVFLTPATGFSQDVLDQPQGWFQVPTPDELASNAGSVFSAWCEVNSIFEPNPGQVNPNKCVHSGDYIALNQPHELRGWWNTRDGLLPTSMTLGANTITSGSWDSVDGNTPVIYVSTSAADNNPTNSINPVNLTFGGAPGLTYWISPFDATTVTPETANPAGAIDWAPWIPLDLSGRCDADPTRLCPSVYKLQVDVSADDQNRSVSSFEVDLIVNPNGQASYNLTTDPGVTASVTHQRVSPGWLALPNTEDLPTREGFITSYLWHASSLPDSVTWSSYVPVIADQTILLDWAAVSSDASPCEVGAYSSTGYHSVSDDVTCHLSPAGTYVDQTGATAATLCPAGTFQANLGSISCDQVPIGTFTENAGATQATPCPSGFTTPGLGSITSAACSVRILSNQPPAPTGTPTPTPTPSATPSTSPAVPVVVIAQPRVTQSLASLKVPSAIKIGRTFSVTNKLANGLAIKVKASGRCTSRASGSKIIVMASQTAGVCNLALANAGNDKYAALNTHLKVKVTR